LIVFFTVSILQSITYIQYSASSLSRRDRVYGTGKRKLKYPDFRTSQTAKLFSFPFFLFFFTPLQIILIMNCIISHADNIIHNAIANGFEYCKDGELYL
jgi:hypothetical protein